MNKCVVAEVVVVVGVGVEAVVDVVTVEDVVEDTVADAVVDVVASGSVVKPHSEQPVQSNPYSLISTSHGYALPYTLITPSHVSRVRGSVGQS